MPHITLLYPFAPRSSFAEVLPALVATCTEVAPFAITLAHFGLFGHGRRGATLYLAPEPAALLVALQTRLWETVPAYDDTHRHANGFTPHLSVGQAHGSAEARALREALTTSWQPLTFTAEAIQLIWRGEPPDDAFRRRSAGGRNGRPMATTSSTLPRGPRLITAGEAPKLRSVMRRRARHVWCGADTGRSSDGHAP